jgi:phosphate-selective porin OprO/OprP
MSKINYFLVMILLSQVGLFAKSEKSYPTYRVGGQILLDCGFVDSKSAVEIRRGRVFVKGLFSKYLAYELEYSLTGDGEWKDLYLEYSGLPYATVKVGNIKEPIGLEALTSSKYNTFMERSLADIFIEDRKLGATLNFNSYEKNSHAWTFTAGGFGGSVNDISDFTDSYSLSSRATYAYFFDKKTFLHLGLSLSYTDIGDEKLKLSTRAESHLLDDKLLKLKIKHVDTMARYGLEAVFQYDKLSLQGEYLVSDIDTTKSDSYSFSGWYVQGSYFLTNDRRNYKAKEGVFKRIKPKKTVKNGGYGAFELATRVSYLDMSDADKLGGEVYNYTVGLNYYINNHTRMMLNYITTDIQSGTLNYDPEVIQLRFQYDF